MAAKQQPKKPARPLPRRLLEAAQKPLFLPGAPEKPAHREWRRRREAGK
jgi:hypothetical protein